MNSTTQVMNCIKTYYKKCMNSVRSILRKPKKEFSDKDFHRLRIGIKKIRAVSALINSCATNLSQPVSTDSFNDIFAHAGKVRDLQIEISFFKKFRKFKSSHETKDMRARLKNAKKVFFRLKTTWNEDEMNKNYRIVSALSASVTDESIRHYINGENAAISNLLEQKHLERQQLHDLRKKLKELNFVAQIQPAPQYKPKQLKAFQKLLGDWHDSVVFEKDLKKISESGRWLAGSNSGPGLLMQKIHNKNERLFDKIDQKRLQTKLSSLLPK